jgi:DNA-directed RNA polymerase specialized sigma24 family protein
MAELIPTMPSASTHRDRPESIIAALKALSDSDARTLKNYAAFRTLAIKGAVFHAGAEDLLHEAIARTMDGRRKQADGVDFVTHLKGCIRSIASEYKEDAVREITHRQAGERDRLTASTSADFQARETLQRIRARLKADKLTLRIFDRLREGYSAAEIRERLGINASIYNASRKRIYRCIQALYEA